MLAVLAVLFVVDVAGDEIPGVDHVLHAIGVVAYPVAGALAFASQAGVIEHLPASVTWVLGGAMAATLHVARSSVRPVASTTTAGLGNPGLSATEDVSSGVLTFLALAVPVLAAVAVLLVLVVLWRFVPACAASAAERRSAAPAQVERPDPAGAVSGA